MMSVDKNSGGTDELDTRWRGTAKVVSVLAVLVGCIAALAQCYQYIVDGRFNLVLAAIFTLLGILGIAVLFAMKQRRAALIGALVMVGVLIAAFGTGAWLYPSLLGVDVTREPVQTPGENPFMPPVGTDQSGVVSPPKTEGAFAGDTKGLYGGTRNASSCDPAQMVAFLQQHPDKAGAWASVLGITPDAIPDYVARLTPAILRSDTYVTNHGFAAGQATSFPATLQAGTAVLVNSRGFPVTKCYCGNPLTEPPARPVRNHVGATWDAFSSAHITVIRPARADITVFTIVNPNTDEIFDRPAGTTGDQDKDSNAQGTQGSPAPIKLDGSWRNANNSSTMTIGDSGGQTTFRWNLLNNPNDPGLRSFKPGPRPEVCVASTNSIRIGRVQLTCQDPREGGRNFSISADVVDHNRLTIDGDLADFFIPLNGSYVRA